MSKVLGTVDPEDTLLIESKKLRDKEISQIEREARIETLKEIDDKLCDLHQQTEGAGVVSFSELGEYLENRIAELNKDKVDE